MEWNCFLTTIKWACVLSLTIKELGGDKLLNAEGKKETFRIEIRIQLFPLFIVNVFITCVHNFYLLFLIRLIFYFPYYRLLFTGLLQNQIVKNKHPVIIKVTTDSYH